MLNFVFKILLKSKTNEQKFNVLMKCESEQKKLNNFKRDIEKLNESLNYFYNMRVDIPAYIKQYIGNGISTYSVIEIVDKIYYSVNSIEKEYQELNKTQKDILSLDYLNFTNMKDSFYGCVQTPQFRQFYFGNSAKYLIKQNYSQILN